MNSQTIPVAVINPDAPAESLEAKQPDIDNGTEIYAKEGYFSAEQMEREWDKVWSESWLIAGVSTDLQEPGDYFLFRVRSESIIVTKTEEAPRHFITSALIGGPDSSANSAATKKYSCARFTAGVFATTVSSAPSPMKRRFRRRSSVIARASLPSPVRNMPG